MGAEDLPGCQPPSTWPIWIPIISWQLIHDAALRPVWRPPHVPPPAQRRNEWESLFRFHFNNNNNDARLVYCASLCYHLYALYIIITHITLWYNTTITITFTISLFLQSVASRILTKMSKLYPWFKKKIIDMTVANVTYRPLRNRRALTLFNNVPLRTRRALSIYNVYGSSALLALNGKWLNCVNALLVLSSILQN